MLDTSMVLSAPDKDIQLRFLHTEKYVTCYVCSLSRYKLKFSPDKIDTMIVQAVCLLDDLDKELNNYIMRCREWYGWHFPELGKIITDNIAFVKTVRIIGMYWNRCNVITHTSNHYTFNLIMNLTHSPGAKPKRCSITLTPWPLPFWTFKYGSNVMHCLLK
jgi:RNA processing factor Prp31